MRDMMAQGRSPRSVARAVACYRGFYRFLRHRRTAAYESRRRPAAAARVEGAAALSFRRGCRSSDRAARCHDAARPCAIAPLSSCCTRPACACRSWSALRPADVNLEASYLTCTGKGDKQRIVPIGDEAATWVKRYLQQARSVLLGKRRSNRALRQRARRRHRADASRLLEDS